MHPSISLTNHIIQAFPQSSSTAGPGAVPLYSRGIVQVPSLRFYGGLSPEWPRRDSICSLAYVDKHFVWSISVVLLVLVWFCFQRRAYSVGVFRLIGPPTSLDSFGVSFCAFKQKQMNSYHEDTASIRSCCSRLPRVWGKDGNDEDEVFCKTMTVRWTCDWYLKELPWS